MGIENIKNTIFKKGGLSQGNRFNVIFSPPQHSLLNLDPEAILGSLASGSFSVKNLINDPRDISFLCQKTSIPGRNISTWEYTTVGHTQSFPYTILDTSISMDFIITNDFYIRKMFDNWMNGIYNPNKHRVGLRDNYSTDVVIQVLDNNNIPTYGVRLEKAYPKTISALDLDNSGTGSMQTMSVTWEYDKYVPEGPVSSILSAVQAAF